VLKITRREGQQWELYSEQSTDIRPEIFKFAVEKQLTVLTINRIEEDLESIFRQLTAKK
jgi:ABC-2 type transport system ATP-binding protein